MKNKLIFKTIIFILTMVAPLTVSILVEEHVLYSYILPMVGIFAYYGITKDVPPFKFKKSFWERCIDDFARVLTLIFPFYLFVVAIINTVGVQGFKAITGFLTVIIMLVFAVHNYIQSLKK